MCVAAALLVDDRVVTVAQVKLDNDPEKLFSLMHGVRPLLTV